LETGLVVQFNQNQKGIKRGSRWDIVDIKEHDVLLKDKSGKTARLDLSKPEHFDVYERKRITVAKGDKMQITRNGFDKERKRMDNGLVLDVVSASKKNGLILL